MTLSSRPGQHFTLYLWVGVDRRYSVELVVIGFVVIAFTQNVVKVHERRFLVENVSGPSRSSVVGVLR